MNGDGSAENVETVQGLYTAFRNGDIDTMLRALASDVRWSEPDNPYNPAAGTRTGHEGFLEWLGIGREAEDVLVLEPRRFLAGDETVAAVGFMRCRARATGRTYESEFVHVFTFREGLIAEFQEFFDTYAAGEAFRREG
jgi:ketosteroid isomerase-like protein